jgi:5-methyltetrahydrofolate--homocysteine methyltransferase
MLYGRHLGVKGAARQLDTPAEAKLRETPEGRKALEVKAMVDGLKAELKAGGWFQPRAVFQFYRAGSEGNALHLFDSQGTPLVHWTLPRQTQEGGQCIADWVAPLKDGVPRDTVALFVTTAGGGIRELSERYKAEGSFLKMHAVQALALETAEAFAEYVHAQLRSMWGHPDAPETTMLQRFRAEYVGKRYSFGYPACPDLEQQRELFEALQPRDIGVELTDGCMMEPEASVSAIALHHPDATYFSVS